MAQTESSCLLVRFSFRAKKKSKPLNLKIHSGVGSCENIPAQQRSPLLSERSLRSFFVGHAPFLPSTPPVHTEANFSASKSPLGCLGWGHQTITAQPATFPAWCMHFVLFTLILNLTGQGESIT